MSTSRYIRDHSAGAFAVTVPCLTCVRTKDYKGKNHNQFGRIGEGPMINLSEAICDTEGPTFQAYYCPAHAPAGSGDAICNKWDCRLCSR